MKALLLCCLLTTLSLTSAISLPRALKRIEVNRLDGMCRRRQVPMRVDYYGIKNEGNVIWLNITTKVTEDIIGRPRVVAQIERCNSKENLDSCQFYRQFKVNYCQMLEMSSLTPVYVQYKPELKCPFKKGVYHALNQKIDLTPAIFITADKVYYRIKADILGEKDRLLMCIEAEGYSVPNNQKD